MKTAFENKSNIGFGIFTIPDMARILNLKYYKVERLLNEYWDNRFASDLGKKYSWTDGNSKAVSFHTLVEFYIFYQLKECGIDSKHILKAHEELSKRYNTLFPFATSSIINKMGTAGKKIVFNLNDGNILDLNFTNQLNLHFIIDFIKKLEFDQKDLAARLWPIGKDKKVVVDPHHQFGQPTIAGTNILAITVYNMFLAHEPVLFIASSYGIKENEISDAIEFCEKVKAA